MPGPVPLLAIAAVLGGFHGAGLLRLAAWVSGRPSEPREKGSQERLRQHWEEMLRRKQ